ncbi:MAG: histidine phosphatase family protein [Xanthobacteraceae bacterium]
MTILLVRHGETDGNAARILQRPDAPLNERGTRQAERLAQRLFAHGVVHILCSDLPRARMTAAPLAALCGIAIEESPLLQERNFGDLRGTPYGDLAENPFGPDFAPPNGEDWPKFHARVAEAFAFIVDRRRGVNGTLVVVTHGLFCHATVERHALVPSGGVVPERFDNTSVTLLHENAPHAVDLLNCTRHLAPLLAAEPLPDIERGTGPA